VHFLVRAQQQIIMQSALNAVARPSHRWISQKRLKFGLGLCNFHYVVAPSL